MALVLFVGKRDGAFFLILSLSLSPPEKREYKLKVGILGVNVWISRNHTIINQEELELQSSPTWISSPKTGTGIPWLVR